MREGLGDVAFADADRAVEDDGLAAGEPAQGGEVADLGGGQFRGGAEVEPFEGGLVLEPVPLENWIPALTWAFPGFRLLARIR